MSMHCAFRTSNCPQLMSGYAFFRFVQINETGNNGNTNIKSLQIQRNSIKKVLISRIIYYLQSISTSNYYASHLMPGFFGHNLEKYWILCDRHCFTRYISHIDVREWGSKWVIEWVCLWKQCKQTYTHFVFIGSTIPYYATPTSFRKCLETVQHVDKMSQRYECFLFDSSSDAIHCQIE